MSGVTQDRRRAVAELESALASTPRATRPYEHAALAYRLGLVYAESAGGDPDEGLRRALAAYDVAAAIFDPALDPVEHARVLNAAGAAHRGLGDIPRAAALFGKAADLLHRHGTDRTVELAATLNNLGLAYAEMGDLPGALAACDEALSLFGRGTEEERRGRVAALQTRGRARAAGGTDADLVAGLEDYRAAAAEVEVDDAPYHHALVHHSIGVTCTELAARTSDRSLRTERIAEGMAAFNESLLTFTRAAFPYQHALAKHNLGRCLALRGEVVDLRRALACFEDAVAVLDPRLHAPAWRHAYTGLEETERALRELGHEGTRAEHFAALLDSLGEPERLVVVRERLFRLLELPDGLRPIAELAQAIARLGYDGARAAFTSALVVLMDVPPDRLEIALRAIVDAQRRLPPESQDDAGGALDQAIGDALGAPQRVFVRDFLYSVGWERP